MQFSPFYPDYSLISAIALLIALDPRFSPSRFTLLKFGFPRSPEENLSNPKNVPYSGRLFWEPFILATMCPIFCRSGSSRVYKLFKMDLRWRMVVLSGARLERDGSVTGRVIYYVQKEPESRRPTRIRGGGFECEESEPYPQEGTCNPGNRNDRRRSGRPRPEIGLISIFVIPHGLITITPLLVPSYGLRFAHVMPAHMSSWRADSRMANSLEVRKPAKETKAGLRGSSKQISGNTPSNPGTVPKGERVLLSLLTGMMKIHSRSNNTLRNYYESKLLKSP